MGLVLLGSAITTEAVRRAKQHSQESLRALAKSLRYDNHVRLEFHSSVTSAPTDSYDD
jgi:hypothetical protein